MYLHAEVRSLAKILGTEHSSALFDLSLFSPSFMSALRHNTKLSIYGVVRVLHCGYLVASILLQLTDLCKDGLLANTRGPRSFVSADRFDHGQSFFIHMLRLNDMLFPSTPVYPYLLPNNRRI